MHKINLEINNFRNNTITKNSKIILKKTHQNNTTKKHSRIILK